MTTQQTITDKLNEAFSPEHLEVINESHMHNVPEGSESHFKVIVVSDAFRDKMPVARHRMVNKALEQELAGGIHALNADPNMAALQAYTIDLLSEVSEEAGVDINIERAIDLLVRTYSALKHNNYDVHEFIRAYTWREMATLPDILGSADLEFNDNGEATGGVEGLHSRAFGHGELGSDLRNLLDDNVRQILGFSTEEDRSAILQRMDTRRPKSERVMQYMEELDSDRGLLG